MTKVFAKNRMQLAAVVIAAVGGAATLAACGSDSATYKAAPRYTTNAPSTQPAPATTYQQPAPGPAPTKAGGQMSCGKAGKCG